MLCCAAPSSLFPPRQADELYSRFLLPAKVSRYSSAQARAVLLPLGPKERLFLVLDDPQCCGLARALSLAMMAVIVLSCVIYVISTDPSLRSGDGHDDDVQVFPHPSVTHQSINRSVTYPSPHV